MSFELAIVTKTTVVLLGAGLALMLLRRASSSTRHAVWTIALLSGLALPVADALFPQAVRMELPVLSTNEGAAVAVRSFVSQSIAPAAPVATAAATTRFPVPAKSSHPLSRWIAIVWGLGFVFFLGRAIVASWAAHRLVGGSTPMSGPIWARLRKKLRSELAITQTVELRNGGTTPPLTWGMFRHFILLPSNADSWTTEQQRAVLAHELAHAKRYDGLTQFLVQIVCSIYWFNPVVWIAARRMRLERERACDDYSLNLGAKAGAYADHLLELACDIRWNAQAMVGIADPSQFEARLRAILNPQTRRGRLSRWTAAFLLASTAAVLFSIAAVHLTSLLSLSLPTTFSAMAAPLVSRPQPDPEQQSALSNTNTGAVAGSVYWADGAPSPGASVSAIATSTEGLPASWIMGTKVVASTVTNSHGGYRIENLPAGLYHIVTGPVSLPRTFSDVSQARVSRSGGPHLVTVTPGKTSGDMNFTCVRNAEGIIYDSDRMLTITGQIVLTSYNRSPYYGLHILVKNADGSVSRWQFRDQADLGRLYWWPGYDAAPGGPIDKMSIAGETVTISGTDTGSVSKWGVRTLAVWEITRGGLPKP